MCMIFKKNCFILVKVVEKAGQKEDDQERFEISVAEPEPVEPKLF